MECILNRVSILIITLIILLNTAVVEAVTRGEKDDILQMTIGAHNAGKGNTYTTQYNDEYGIFANPASLSTIDSVRLFSQAYKFIGVYNYSLVGVAFPYEDYVLGFGYSAYAVGGIPDNELTDAGKIVRDGSFSGGEKNYLVSVAKEMEFDFLPKLFLGSSFKVVDQYISGENRLGYGLNVGAVIPSVVDNLDVGLAFANIIAPTLEWEDGETDEEASRLALGLKYRAGQKWQLSYDYQDEKNCFGVNYILNEQCELRGGLNGSIFTLGIGADFGNIIGMDYQQIGVGFDYAFAYDQDMADFGSDAYTHYFALSFYGESKSLEPKIISDSSYTETESRSIKIKGTARQGSYVTVYYNNLPIEKVKTDSKGNWEKTVELQRGLNVFHAVSKENNKLDSDISNKIIIRKK